MLPTAKLHAFRNGFRTVTIPIPSSEIVTVVIAVRAGARAEYPAQRGIAHFVEHMAFKGSRHFPKATDFDEAVAEIGGYSNASTNLEFTYFVLQAPKAEGLRAARLVSDMAVYPRVPEYEFPQEKRVVAEEIIRTRQDDEDYVQILFEELAYEHQPLGWEIAGSKKTVERLTRPQIVKFLKKWYVANNMTAVIVGGGNLNAIAAECGKVFSEIPRGPVPQWKPFRRNRNAPRARNIVRGEDLMTFMVGVPGVTRRSPHTVTQRVLDNVLCGDTASRLHMRVREREGLVYVIQNLSEFYTDAGHTATATQASVANAPIVLEHILDEYRRIVVDPVTEKELRLAKATMIGKLATMPEDQEAMAEHFLKGVLLQGKITQLSELKKAVRSITLASVRRLAEKLYAQKPFLANIGPKALSLPRKR